MPDSNTLHEALAQHLRDNGNGWMTVTELTDAVNRAGSYVTRAGSPVMRLSVDTRTRRYTDLFEREVRGFDFVITSLPRRRWTGNETTKALGPISQNPNRFTRRHRLSAAPWRNPPERASACQCSS